MATKLTTPKAPKSAKRGVMTRGRAAPVADASGVLEAPVFGIDGKQLSTIALPVALFGAPWRADLVHQVVTAQQANARQNRASTKDRAQVSGGGKKPWKQKGTGQARHGSSRSPIWRHGGVTFGPNTARDYHEKINRRMKGGALASVLSKKAAEGELILVDSLSFAAPSTAGAKASLIALAKGASAATLATKRKNGALIALANYDANAIKSFRNMGNVKTEEARNMSVVDLLTHKYVVIESPEATFKLLAARLTK